MYEVPTEVLEIAKALGEETRFDIFRRIASSSEPLSVKELVSQLGMHHSAIRIHLNKLQDAGLIYAKKRHMPGVVGRPQLAFLPSAQALSITLPPRNYELLARLAMDLASAHEDAESPEDFGVQWGRGYMRESGRFADGPVPLDDAVHALMVELRQLGASGNVSRVAEGYQILETNCVFAELAADHAPLVCSLHQGVMRGMLTEMSADQFDWHQTSAICNGGDSCVTHVTPRTLD